MPDESANVRSQQTSESVFSAPDRTLVHIKGPSHLRERRTIEHLQQVAHSLTSAPIGDVENVLLLSTAKPEIRYTELSQIVDLGKQVEGVRVLARHPKPKLQLSLNEIVKGAPAGATAERLIIIIVWGPIIIIWDDGDIVVVVLDW